MPQIIPIPSVTLCAPRASVLKTRNDKHFISRTQTKALTLQKKLFR